jgi:hypothetical protein
MLVIEEFMKPDGGSSLKRWLRGGSPALIGKVGVRPLRQDTQNLIFLVFVFITSGEFALRRFVFSDWE